MTPFPILAKCGHRHNQQNFHCHFHPIIYESSLHQALHNVTLSTTPSNFHLTPSHGMVSFSISFRVVAIFPVGHFITTLTPQKRVRHESRHCVLYCLLQLTNSANSTNMLKPLLYFSCHRHGPKCLIILLWPGRGVESASLLVNHVECKFPVGSL